MVYVDHLFGEFDKSVVELTHPAYRRQALAPFLQHAGSNEGNKKERHPGLDPGSHKWQSKTSSDKEIAASQPFAFEKSASRNDGIKRVFHPCANDSISIP